MSAEHAKKGRQLEQAVKFIQETILKSSPELKGTTFTIETNVRDRSSGVLHEIDVLVKTNQHTDYETAWIFECKNWADPVGKNEVIVLAEKVEALRANKGFLVAKAITSEAQAQLAQKKRLEFIRCSEDFLPPFTDMQAVHTAADLLPITLYFRYCNLASAINPPTLDIKNVNCRVFGQPINFLDYIKPHIDELVRGNLNKYRTKYNYSGAHWGRECVEMCFAEGEMFLNGLEVESIVIQLLFFVVTSRRKIISKFELEGRGRIYSFEPIEDFEDGKQLEIHIIQKI